MMESLNWCLGYLIKNSIRLCYNVACDTNMRTLIIIPAYNEQDNIEKLIEDINSFGYDYLIINDNSTDNTENIIRNNKYNFLDLPINVGIAGVTRIGFKYAYENGYDCAICIDGDGQHQPKYVHDLIKEIDNGYDYVVGSRFIDEKKPFSLRMFGSRIICFFIRLKTGVKVSDPTSGMRALGKNVLKDFAESMNFYAEPDAMCYTIHHGYKVKEVQVEMKERDGGESYFKNPFKSIKFMVGVLLSIIFVQW